MAINVTFGAATPLPIDWQARALSAEAERDALRATIATTPKLISLIKDGRTLRMLFQRGGKMITVESYALMSMNTKALQHVLLGPIE